MAGPPSTCNPWMEAPIVCAAEPHPQTTRTTTTGCKRLGAVALAKKKEHAKLDQSKLCKVTVLAYSMFSNVSSLKLGERYLEDCKGRCAASRSRCAGIEYSLGRCELWIYQIAATTNITGFQCFQYSDPRAKKSSRRLGQAKPAKLETVAVPEILL